MKRPCILLIGKNGQLGWEFKRTLACLGEVTTVDWPEVDLANSEAVREAVRKVKPQVIVNAAAYTAVDRAERETDKARAINATATGILAEEARELGAGLIHFSTDYVFDGQKSGTYNEGDEPNPLNVYGLTKLEGEREAMSGGGAVWILRTSWVYSDRRDSFVNKVLEWSRSQKQMRVVSDQMGCPTWSRMLAEITTLALAMGLKDPVGWIGEKAGMYHLAGDGGTSRYQFAQEILKLDPQRSQQVVTDLVQAQTSEFPTPARRPLNAIMDCSKFKAVFGISLPPWQEALGLMLRR